MVTTEQHPAQAFFNANNQFIDNLAARWEDESEFEDINDYKAALQKAATPFGLTIGTMSRRPFGCTLTSADNKTFRVRVLKTQIKFEQV